MGIVLVLVKSLLLIENREKKQEKNFYGIYIWRKTLTAKGEENRGESIRRLLHCSQIERE